MSGGNALWYSSISVRSMTSLIASLPLEFTPAQYLLHFSKIPRRHYYKSVAMHMITNPRLCLPVHWRSIPPPSMKEWTSRVNHIAAMEELIYTTLDKIPEYSATWEAWKTYWESQSYQELIQNSKWVVSWNSGLVISEIHVILYIVTRQVLIWYGQRGWLVVVSSPIFSLSSGFFSPHIPPPPFFLSSFFSCPC